MADNQVDYGKISRVYDVSRAANAETASKLITLLGVNRHSVIIELGCGTGNYTFAMQRRARLVAGIDISPAMIQKARGKFPGLQFVIGDVTSLPFRADSFDGAIAIQVLHHVKDRSQFLRETCRVLRKGASVAIHSCSHRQMHAFWFYHYFPKGLDIDLARIPDSTDIASLLTNAGFTKAGIEVCFTDAVVKNETPENYLDRAYRNGVSTFALLSESDIEKGCRMILDEIHSGEANSLVRRSEEEVSKHVGGSCIVYGRK